MLTGVRSESSHMRYSVFYQSSALGSFVISSQPSQGVMEMAFGMNGKEWMFACYKTPGADTEQEELRVHQLKLKGDFLLGNYTPPPALDPSLWVNTIN